MNSSFDPYYKWFGIPAGEQPANYYRLLGVGVYEQDREAIDAAAEQRMNYLRSLCSPEELPYAERLLAEVSRARVTLLSADSRAAYDAGLRHGLAAAALPPADDMVAGTVPIPEHILSSEAGTHRRRPPEKSAAWPPAARASLAGLLGAVLILGCLLVFSGEQPLKRVGAQPGGVASRMTTQGQDRVAHLRHPAGEHMDSGAVPNSLQPGDSKSRNLNPTQKLGPLATADPESGFHIGGLRGSNPVSPEIWRSHSRHVDTQPDGGRTRCRFRLRQFATGGQVFLVGSFNDWDTTAHSMNRTGDFWEIVLPLPHGEHQYKFLVDGAWKTDPNVNVFGDSQNHRIQLAGRGGFKNPPGEKPTPRDSVEPQSAPANSGPLRQARARRILEAAGLREESQGVWGLKEKGLFPGRAYGRIAKDPSAMRALSEVQGRFPAPFNLPATPP